MSKLKSIQAAGLQLNEMITDILDISKIEAGKMSIDVEAFSVIRVFESFQDQLQTLADLKGLTYEVTCDSSLSIRSDYKKVRQIMINFISNAIKYTLSGGIYVLVAECNHDDTGMGIPKEQIDKLFEAYHRVGDKKSRGIQGTGLGLALVSELTNMLNGKVSIKSTEGEGSTFSVFLPVQ